MLKSLEKMRRLAARRGAPNSLKTLANPAQVDAESLSEYQGVAGEWTRGQRCLCGKPAGALTTADVHDDREGALPLCDACAGIAPRGETSCD